MSHSYLCCLLATHRWGRSSCTTISFYVLFPSEMHLILLMIKRTKSNRGPNPEQQVHPSQICLLPKKYQAFLDIKAFWVRMFFLPKLHDTSDLRGHANYLNLIEKKMCLPNLLTRKTLQKHSSAQLRRSVSSEDSVALSSCANTTWSHLFKDSCLI